MQGLQLPNPESAPTPESIHQLRKQLEETIKLNLALKAKQARNAALIKQLHAITSPPSNTNNAESPESLAFLTQDRTNGSSHAPLTTQTQFAVSQLPALRQLVSELRPKLDKLKSTSPGDVPRDARKEERRQYIESGVRRVIARGGLNNGEGDLKTMNGERRGREEVEMLERVVRGIGDGDRMET